MFILLLTSNSLRRLLTRAFLGIVPIASCGHPPIAGHRRRPRIIRKHISTWRAVQVQTRRAPCRSTRPPLALLRRPRPRRWPPPCRRRRRWLARPRRAWGTSWIVISPPARRCATSTRPCRWWCCPPASSRPEASSCTAIPASA